jgi:hypothetical protein
MNDFEQHLDQDRRLTVLHLLAESPGFYATAHLLQSGLEPFGHRVSVSRVAGDLTWLHEAGLVKAREIESVHVAELTQLGLDVADGRATHPGVRRPVPRG